MTVTWSIDLDGTEIINKTENPENIETKKAKKSTRIKNILFYDGN